MASCIFATFLFCYDYHGLGYPHDGRADKNSYPHDCRADNAPYRHDRRADKNPFRHDRNMKFSSQLNQARCKSGLRYTTSFEVVNLVLSHS